MLKIFEKFSPYEEEITVSKHYLKTRKNSDNNEYVHNTHHFPLRLFPTTPFVCTKTYIPWLFMGMHSLGEP